MKAPAEINTERLRLRPPRAADAEAIFARYASDAEVTRYLSWPTHRSIEDTRAFLEFSAAEWKRWPAGPYLIFSRADGALLGSTGLTFEATDQAQTGYVIAGDSWGNGYATEALIAMVEVAPRVGVRRLYALCHPEHQASQRVLEKGGFACEGILSDHTEFPNLNAGVLVDVMRFGYGIAADRADDDGLHRQDRP